jgi:hypothetical protein
MNFEVYNLFKKILLLNQHKNTLFIILINGFQIDN